MLRLTALALLLASPAAAGKRYASLLIDRVDRTASLSEPLGLFSTEKTYFDKTTEKYGFKVEDRRDGSLRGVYHFTEDGRLAWRTETLLAYEDEFGAVFAELRFSYQGEDKPVHPVRTRAKPRSTPRQGGEPASAGPKELFSYALVRVVRAEPRFLIATADYDASGGMKTFNVEASTGDWRATVGGDWAPSGGKSPEEFGLPVKIKPAKFAADPFDGLIDGVHPHEADVALIYGDRGEHIERKVRRGSQIKSSRLRFPPTEIERALLKSR